jgi:hypothetical protein
MFDVKVEDDRSAMFHPSTGSFSVPMRRSFLIRRASVALGGVAWKLCRGMGGLPLMKAKEELVLIGIPCRAGK